MPIRSRFNLLNPISTFFKFDLDPIRSYLEYSVDMLKEEEGHLSQKYQQYEAEYKRDNDGPDALTYFDKEIMHHNAFPKILFNSLFMISYSHLEHQLFRICDFMQGVDNISLSVKDINGQDYMDKCKKYIEKVFSIDLSGLNDKFQKLRMYQQLRNAFVHSDGQINEGNTGLQNFVRNEEGLEYVSNNHFINITDKKFVHQFNDFSIMLIQSITIIIIQQTSDSNS